jgi:hypothetical protein
MAHWKRSFPSKYLQTTDLDNGPIVTTIISVDNQNVGVGDDAELKPVAKLRDAKSLVLNVTKCNAIEEIAGTGDMDAWPGTRIKLQKGKTTYKGKRVPCIVVEPAPKTPDVELPGESAVPF